MHAHDNDTHWLALSSLLRQALSRGPFSLAAAQAAFDATPAQELSPEAVDLLIARATVLRRNGSAARNGAASPQRAARKLMHEPLERRDLLAPLFDWLCGAAHFDAPAPLPAAPAHSTACYAAAW